MQPAHYSRTSMSEEQLAEHDRVYGDLTRATRELMDAQLRTELGYDEVAAVTDEIRGLTKRLLERARSGPHGVELRENGRSRAPGNAVVGVRNPIAALVDEHAVVRDEAGARADIHLNALYEGPPGLVHGGVSALVLDQVCGEAAASAGTPGMTGRLTLQYRRPTPLGDLSVAAWVEHSDGVKTLVRGHIKDPDGNVTVEAEALFILPRWAREALEHQNGKAPDRFE